MIDLSTNYLGLKLRNPLIAGSSGLTSTVENLKKIEEKGAGAVVLKSLFEEQISYEIHKSFAHDEMHSAYTEAEDYIKNYAHTHKLNEYLDFVSAAKKSIKIPVIASINCVTASEWTSFARKIQDAGADAIELNVFVLPADPNKTGLNNENIYFDIVEKVKKEVTIPISLKVSYYFSELAQMMKKLSWTGIQGIVMFNRFYSPDIDIDELKIKPASVYSNPEEISIPLRWIALLRDEIKIDLCSSTGVYDGTGVVKMLLAGANAVQVCSTLYQNGFDQIEQINNQLIEWMKKHDFNKISDFAGKMSFKKATNPAAYQRVQFMKHFSGIE
ncbi:MAG: dihydroorotate dehydrogenase-like protein [Bacteroidales bacterium]